MSEVTTLRLLLVRHGETDLNREHRMQGRTDRPLNDRGRRQLGALAERLRDERIDAAWASDLVRARDSARILAAPHGLAVSEDPRLREQDFGDWEGAVWPGLESVAAPGDVDRFLADADFHPPGGESKSEVLARLDSFFAERFAVAAGETILVVSHGGPVQVLLHAALSIPWSTAKRLYASNGGLTEMLRVDGYWRLVTFDGKSHLRGLA